MILNPGLRPRAQSYFLSLTDVANPSRALPQACSAGLSAKSDTWSIIGVFWMPIFEDDDESPLVDSQLFVERWRSRRASAFL